MDLFQDKLLNFIASKKWAIDFEFGFDRFNAAIINSNVGFERPELIAAATLTIKNSNQTNSVPYKIKEIVFDGTMFLNDTLCEYGINKTMVEPLYQAYEDKTIDGVLITMNTGGGESGAAVAMDNALKDKNKPVMVHSQLLASGGIWGTLGATEIMAGYDGLFGSVGVYTTINNKMMQFIKENYTNVYATQSGKKQKVFRAMIEGDMDAVTAYVDEVAQTFIDKVKPKINANHPLAADLFAGDTFNSEQSKALGLVNSIGTRYDAINQLHNHIKSNKYLSN